MELPGRTVDHIHRVFGPAVGSDSEASDREENLSPESPRNIPWATLPASSCVVKRAPPYELRRAATPSNGRLQGHRYDDSSDGEDQAAAACRPAWAEPGQRAPKVAQIARASNAPVSRAPLPRLSSSCSEDAAVVAHAARLGRASSLASSTTSQEDVAHGSKGFTRHGGVARRQPTACSLSLQSSVDSELELDGGLGGAVETSMPSWLRWAHRVFSSPSSSCSSGSGSGDAARGGAGAQNRWTPHHTAVGCYSDEIHMDFIIDVEAAQAQRLPQGTRIGRRPRHVALGSLGRATVGGSLNNSIPAHRWNRSSPGKPPASPCRRLKSAPHPQGQGKSPLQGLQGQMGEYGGLQQPAACFAAVGGPSHGTGQMDGSQHAGLSLPRRSLQAQLDGVSRKDGSSGSLEWPHGGTNFGQEIWHIKAVHGLTHGEGSSEPALWETASAPAAFEGEWPEEGMLLNSRPAMQHDILQRLARGAAHRGHTNAQQWQQHLHVMPGVPIAEVAPCHEHSEQAYTSDEQRQQAEVVAVCSESQHGAAARCTLQQHPAGLESVEQQQHKAQQVVHRSGMQPPVARVPALATRTTPIGFSTQQPAIGAQDSTAQAEDQVMPRKRRGWKRFFCFRPQCNKSPKLGGNLGQ